MTTSFKDYRRQCFTVIRDLLAHKPKSERDLWLLRAKASKTSAELSRIMADVRDAI